MTTTLVVAEGHAWFLRRYDQARALQFLALIEDLSPLRVHGVDAQALADATPFLRRFSDQRLTLTDAVGLAVMKSHRIRSCWSTDRHLGLTGVPLAIHKR